jgi:hypothetical protein
MMLQRFERAQYRNSLDFNFGYEALHPAMVRGREIIGGWHVTGLRLDETSAVAGPPPTPVAGNIAIETVDQPDERFDDLCREAAAQFRLIALRNSAYLSWRYCDPRGGGGTLLAASDGDTLVGYAAFRVSNGAGYLCDVLALPGREDAVALLAAESLRRQRKKGVEETMCWLPSRHPYRDALASAGWSDAKRSRAFTYEALYTPEADLAFLMDEDASVHLMIGDTDLV